jgi:Transposase DDE domain
VVFEKLVQVLVFGCAYRKIADEECSATTLRDRRDEWIACGVMDALREIVLELYDRFIGLELSDVAVDGCITKAPRGGEKAGKSPIDRGKQGIKRSTAVDAKGIPIGGVTAPANRHDSPLLVPTLEHASASLGGLPEGASVHLDRGYDSFLTRDRLRERRLDAQIANKGQPAPLQAGQRWMIERTNSWHNAHKSFHEKAKIVKADVAAVSILQQPRRRRPCACFHSHSRWVGFPATRCMMRSFRT